MRGKDEGGYPASMKRGGGEEGFRTQRVLEERGEKRFRNQLVPAGRGLLERKRLAERTIPRTMATVILTAEKPAEKADSI